MRERLTRTFAIVGWVVALAAAIGAIAWRIVDPAPFIPTGFGFSEPALVGFEFLGFSDRLRDEVDLAALSGDLDTTIRDAIAPRSIGIWLRESRR